MPDDIARNDPGDFDAAGASVRPGGEAAGGIEPRPEDPAAPKPADGKDRQAMRDLGFGDDKGGDIS